MCMPRRITGSIAAVVFGFAALTSTGAHAADPDLDSSTATVEQDTRVVDTRTKEERVAPTRTKEERVGAYRTKEE